MKRLADALGAAGKEKKVERYYHEMEQGMLPAKGVSNRVLDAIGSIVGASGEALRRAGAAFPPGPPPTEGAALARTATPDEEYDSESSGAPAPASPAERTEMDEVDKLFTGG